MILGGFLFSRGEFFLSIYLPIGIDMCIYVWLLKWLGWVGSSVGIVEGENGYNFGRNETDCI